MRHDIRQSGFSHWQACLGALLAASAVALAAYASHVAEGTAQSRLQMAAIFAFGHGVALVALAPQVTDRLRVAASLALQLGVLLFCGSLAAGVLLAWPAGAAPVGGMLMIGGWLLWAVAALRRH